MSGTDRGGSRIVIYLADATEVELEAFADFIADFAVSAFAADDDSLRCVIAVEPYLWPATAEQFIAEASANAARLILPQKRSPDVEGTRGESSARVPRPRPKESQ